MSDASTNSSKEQPVLLIIGLVWPEPKATAAGTRMLQLIRLFRSRHYQIHFASAAEKGSYSYPLQEEGVILHTIELNSSSFNQQLAKIDPQVVVFDRFISEEQFGWRVKETCPDCLCILDTEDLHFLRKAREIALRSGGKSESYLINDITKREVAAMYRCDLSLIISETEIKLLKNTFNFPETLLFHLPFLPEYFAENSMNQLVSFQDRTGFMFLGNGKHAPNLDAIRFLKEDIWPGIRKQLPEVNLHIYGAYLPESVQQMHSEKEGFIVKGWIDNKQTPYSAHKVFLSPVRFGAGLKGKLVDCMQYGLPNVASYLAAEGFDTNNGWNGFLADEQETIISKAVELYSDENCWMKAQKKGIEIYGNLSENQRRIDHFYRSIEKIKNDLSSHRNGNFIGTMLQHHSLLSTRYLSKWIEAKNR